MNEIKWGKIMQDGKRVTDEINNLVHNYKVDVENIYFVPEENKRFGIEVMTGTTEGYYVVVRTFAGSHYLRFHDYNEAAKCMGVMMVLMPTNF